MKKIICFLLSIVMSCGVIVYAEPNMEQEYTYHKYQYAINVMQGLGLMDTPAEESEWQNKITRGEMSEILYRILNYDTYDSIDGEWSGNFYGDKDANISLITNVAEDSKYSDVDSEHKYYKHIKHLSERGILQGVGDGTFKPDEPIVPMHAAQVMIRLMGYTPFIDSYTDKNEGYNQYAVNLELVSGSASSMTRAEAAQFMYNALITEYENLLETENTILEKYLGVSYIKGVMNDNGYVSLESDESVGQGKVKIDNQTLMLNENSPEIIDFLGRMTAAYYKSEGEDNEFEIIFAMLTEDDECFEIKGRDVEKYQSGVLTYYDGSRIRNEKLDDGAIIVHNNEVKESYKSDLFTADNSYISLITPKNGSKVETVIIKEYESVFVGAAENNKVYNTIQYPSKSNIIDFDEELRPVIIYNADGTTGTFKDIKVDTVIDVIESDNLIIAKICDEKITEFKLSGKETNEYGTVYKSAEAQYNLNNELKNATNVIDVKIGEVYKVYMNSFGDIAWLETTDNSDGIKYAFMLKAVSDEDSFELPFMINVLNNKNEWSWIHLAEKATYSNEYGEEKKFTDDEMYNSYLKDYRGIIRYKTDEAGYLTYIEVPITDKKSTVDNKLRLLAKVGYEDANNDGKYDGTAWRTGSNNIGPDVIVDSTAKFIAQNPELDEESKEAYSFTGNVLRDFEYYTLDAFVTNADSHKAEFVMIQMSVSSDNLTVQNRGVAVVKNIETVLNEDDEAVMALEVYDMPENMAGYDTTLYLKDAETINNVTNMFKDVDKNGKPITYTLKKGDLIRYAVDSYGKVDTIQLLWEQSKPNELAQTGKTGGFVGTINWWDETMSGRTNPFGFVNDGVVSQSPLKITDLNFRALSGYAYKVYDGVLTVTTQDLSVNTYDILEKDSRFVSESYLILNKNRVSRITINGNKITAGVGTQDDIRPYDKYGSDCSRVILLGSNGSVARMIIINEEYNR